jgi:hypothetical protein
MSLEDKIGELTAAVNALAAVLAYSAAPATLTGAKPFVPDVTHYPEAKAEVAPPKSPPTQKPVEPTTAPSTSPASETSVTTSTIDYAQVAKAITDTFKVDRAKTIETLAMFGAAKGPQLKPEDYALFLKVLTA